ncbi:unnamed protein product [Camellia sinensis]
MASPFELFSNVSYIVIGSCLELFEVKLENCSSRYPVFRSHDAFGRWGTTFLISRQNIISRILYYLYFGYVCSGISLIVIKFCKCI